MTGGVGLGGGGHGGGSLGGPGDGGSVGGGGGGDGGMLGVSTYSGTTTTGLVLQSISLPIGAGTLASDW